MLDPEAPGELGIMTRDFLSGEKRVDGQGLSVGAGGVKAGANLIRSVDPGTWYHIEVTYGGAFEAEFKYAVSVSTADGLIARKVIHQAKHKFKRPDWIGFSGLGPMGTRAYLDNIVVRVEK